MAHLTESDRMQIERYLSNKMLFKEIAEKLNKSRSTILREVLKHRQESFKVSQGRIANRCIYRRNCDVYCLCEGINCDRKCSTCRLCNKTCSKFREEVCPELSRNPYVCNGCSEEYKCTLKKQFYIGSVAHKEYLKKLVQSREGVNLTENERIQISKVIHAGTYKGQSVHHIMSANKDSFNVCEKSVYRYINAGIIRTKRGDMPRSCMMKPRKQKSIEHKVDKKCRINRTYDDYQKYCKEYPDLAIVEMDSVLGGRGGKVLLTINFNNCGLLLAFLRNSNNSQSVIDTFNSLEELIGFKMFKTLFPLILTDNGSEFSNPVALEISPFLGKTRTKIYFCNPYSSWQKGHVENNHTNLRKILPKGKSFDGLSQKDINLVLSHVNSMARKSLNDIPAITLFETIYGKSILDKLGIELINKNDVYLQPELINK